jgi:homoserine/homoserine lactone efflux protein
MNIESLVLYFVTWLLVALTPGPAVVWVMSQAARYGLESGFRGVVGIQIGNLIFFLCLAFGLVTLLMAITNAFLVLQIAGAVYLLYLGVRMIIISSFQRSAGGTIPTGWPAEKPGHFVLQAVLVQLTNPKALMFVSALVPQFLDPERPWVLQLAILLSCTVAVDTVVLGSYVLLAARGGQAVRHTGIFRWIECAFGLALVGLGVRLLDWRK